MTSDESRDPPQVSDDLTSASTVAGVPGTAVRWIIRLLALSAASVAGYLLTTSVLNWGLPLGCAAGSGCEEVLSSRWSVVAGVPVSGPALAVYAAVIVATFFIGRRQPPARQRIAWGVLLVLAAGIAAAAVWFIVLQGAVLNAWCKWCMADHTLGLLLAAFIFWRAPIGRQAAPTPVEPPVATVRPLPALRLALAGGLAVACLVLAQFVFKYTPPQIIRLPAGQNADSGPGPRRAISVLDGKLQLAVHDEPVLGSPDAPKLVVILLDYCCPHCRAAHEYLLHGMDRYEELAVVALPMPMDEECNPHVRGTEPRFEFACELARLALAVWRADRKAFAEFDRWLFEPEMPRHPRDARAKALELVGAEALERGQTDPWVREAIERNANAYGASQAGRIPVILSPTEGFEPIVGRPESEEQLLQMLEKGLGLTLATP